VALKRSLVSVGSPCNAKLLKEGLKPKIFILCFSVEGWATWESTEKSKSQFCSKLTAKVWLKRIALRTFDCVLITVKNEPIRD